MAWVVAGLALSLVGVSPQAVAARIYVATGNDGSIVLSDIRESRDYRLLLNEKSDRTAASGQARKIGGMARTRFDDAVAQIAQAYGLDSALLHAVISVESAYNPAAVSPKGARGLMQLMPETALRYGVADSFDPVQNLRGGAGYLRDLMSLFDGDLQLVLAAYNAGENAVVRYGRRIPPFRETLTYVPRVLAYYERYLAGRL